MNIIKAGKLHLQPKDWPIGETIHCQCGSIHSIESIKDYSIYGIGESIKQIAVDCPTCGRRKWLDNEIEQ